MKHNVIETAMGAVVLAVAAIFIVFALRTADIDTSRGYHVSAGFNSVNGLLPGSDVRVGGVKVGTVSAISLDPRTYQAVASLTIENSVQMPADTSATIRSESLLGGKYLALEPGGAEKMLVEGSRIQYTQSTADLEQMLGQAIFSMSQGKKDDGAAAQPAAPASAVAPPAAAPPAP